MEIQVSFNGLESSEPLKDKVIDKIEKYSEFLEDATTIQVIFRENVHARGIDKDFKMDINVNLPKARVRVDETGNDMYAIIDTGVETLGRRLRRYHGKKRNWEGETPWRVMEADEAMKEPQGDELEGDNYADYVPKIAVRKQVEDLSPMSEGEAIEQMELMGFRQMLFKNKSTGKISMIYSREQGGYGLVEPADNLDIE